MPGIEHRSISPILLKIRDVFRGKGCNYYPLRFADLVAARTQPQPQIPAGPHHKLSKVYYYTRDARREVQPPIEVTPTKQIEAAAEAMKEVKQLTPAKLYIPKE